MEIENNWCDRCGEYCNRDLMYPVGDLHYCPDCLKEHKKEMANRYMQDHFKELGDILNPEQI